MYTENDWWSYLRHSWGTKPEQKAAEKQYNKEYYEKNKERIMARRKQHGDVDTEVTAISSTSDASDRVSSINSEIEQLMAANAQLGGYDDETMANIKQHNQMIIDNLKALQEKVDTYIKENEGKISEEQKAALYKSLSEQVSKARDQALDLRKESTKGYLSDIGAKPGSSTKKSSGKSSNNASSGSSSNVDSKIYTEGAKRRASNKNASSSSSSSKESTPWYKQGDERYEKATKKKK